MRPALAMLLLAFIVSPARADPLDDWCKTARLPSSIAICSDAELRTLAIERQRTFDEAEARLSPDQQKALLADQNAWVRLYARVCGLSDMPSALALAPEVKACMARAGWARIAYLRAYGSFSASPPLGQASAHFAQTPPASATVASSPTRIGPSFDCNKADRPLALIICASPALSKVDLRFVQAYQALRQQVGKDGQRQLRQEAIDFQNAVLRACRIPETGPVLGSPECVAAEYERQRSIWLSRLNGPASEEASRPIEQHIALQARLQKLGSLPAAVTIDGVYGDATRSAILAWQGVNRRPQTGFLDDADATALAGTPETEATSATQSPSRGQGVPGTLDPEVAGTQMMNAQYGARNDSVKEWRYIVGTDQSRVEFRIKDFVANKVKTPYGERLYVVARGDAQGDGTCHACPGLVGAFLLENHDGRLEMIAGSKDLREGSFGNASDIKVRFQQLGNDALYGWVLEASYLEQGDLIERYYILMPKGKTIGFVGDLPKYEDDSDSLECSQPPNNCFKVKYDLTFDTSNGAAQQPYPIVLQRSGTKGNRTIALRRFQIDFDKGRGEYTVPEELAPGVDPK